MLNMQILYGPLTKKCDIEQIEKNTEESYQTCHFTKKIAIQGTSTPSKFIHTKI